MKKELAVLLTVVLCAIAGVGHAATPLNVIISNDVPPQSLSGRLRLVNTSPDSGPLDVWVDGVLAFTKVQFQEITGFTPTGFNPRVTIVSAGTGAPALIDTWPYHYGSSFITMVITGLRDGIRAQVAPEEASRPAPGSALVRAFNASPDTEAASISLVGGHDLSSWHEFGEWTYYQNTLAGTYDVKVNSWWKDHAIELTVPNIAFAPGGVFTVYLTGLSADSPYEYHVPGMAHTDGFNGSRWRSDLGLLNASTASAYVEVRFFGNGGVVSGTTSVPAGSQSILTDVVGQLGATGQGALEILTDQPLKLTARTYNQAGPDGGCLANGTQGQGFPVLAAGEGLSEGQTAYLPGLVQNADYRTNIGLVNTAEQTAIALVELFDGAGTKLAEYTVELAPGQWAQADRPFEAHAGQTAMDRGYARITVQSGSGVSAFASVIDNLTHDPTTVAMQR